jgi:energy-coupling factor transporter ATP-binding protein EcfA2
MQKPSLRDYAYRIVAETGRSVFLTGRAGTGKSTLLRETVARLQEHKKVAVLAPTGIAAIQVGGETLHAFFRLPFGPIPPGDARLKTIRYASAHKKLVAQLDLLVIDEISMVRADILDAVDYCLRRLRDKPGLPFGGLQLLLVGDLLQLEPVTRPEERELLGNWYRSPYFFEAQAIREIDLVAIELKEVFRQSDPGFIELLDRIRRAEPSYEDLVTLNHLPKAPPHEQSDYCITLTSTRSAADATNRKHLDELPGEVVSYRGLIDGDFPRSHMPTEELLELKPGAQVVFVRNDGGFLRRWVNGTLGVVVQTGEGQVSVKLRDGSVHEVEPVQWENTRYTQNAEGKLVAEVKGTFQQLPLALAWAITIHKSQGLTFDRASIDLGNGAFAAGQLYVALSRCTRMEGLYLRRRLRRSDAMIREEVLLFQRQMHDEQSLRELLGE